MLKCRLYVNIRINLNLVYKTPCVLVIFFRTLIFGLELSACLTLLIDFFVYTVTATYQYYDDTIKYA